MDYPGECLEFNSASAWMIAPFRAVVRVFDGAANRLQGVLNILQNPQLILLHSASGVFLSFLRNQDAVTFVDDQMIYNFFFGWIVVLRAAKNELRNERQRQYLFDPAFQPKAFVFSLLRPCGVLR